MNQTEKAANELSVLAQQKAHLESVQRLMVALQQELRDAGVKDTADGLGILKFAIGKHQDDLSEGFDNALFRLTLSE